MLGRIFHIAHTVSDAAAAEAWYRDVLGARPFLPLHTLEAEKRDAALVAVADTVLEPVSPTFTADGWETRSFGKYYRRFGAHWHSLAWYTDDGPGLWERCRAAGIRVNGMNGPVTARPGPAESLFTHPKDTGVQLQFTPLAGSRYEALDPRLRPDWDGSWWEREHPLGLRGPAYLALLCDDLDASVRLFVDVLGGRRLADGATPLAGLAWTDVAVGDSVVRLSVAIRRGSPPDVDFETNGPGVHAVAFRVADLDRAAAHLESCGVRVTDRDDDLLITDPGTTLGVPFHWTTR
jgi:catechol 2,3-dioxygenase-like lactoylglutathione lyase family enzyme